MRSEPRFHAVRVTSGWLCSRLETSNSTAEVESPMPRGVAVGVGVGVGVEGAGRGISRSSGLTGVGSGTSCWSLRVTSTLYVRWAATSFAVTTASITDAPTGRASTPSPINFAVQQQVDSGVWVVRQGFDHHDMHIMFHRCRVVEDRGVEGRRKRGLANVQALEPNIGLGLPGNLDDVLFPCFAVLRDDSNGNDVSTYSDIHLNAIRFYVGVWRIDAYESLRVGRLCRHRHGAHVMGDCRSVRRSPRRKCRRQRNSLPTIPREQ